jgi:plastocyanin
MNRFAAVLIAVLALACGPSGPSADNCTTANAPSATAIDLKNYEFAPSCIKVAQGTEVTFTNKGPDGHSVATDGSQPETFDSGVLAKDGTFKHTFGTKGTIKGHCNPHPILMHFAVVVE